MKKLVLSFVFILVTLIEGFSQSTVPAIDSKEYESLKKQGMLPKDLILTNPHSFTPSLDDLKKLGSVHPLGLPGTPGNPPKPASGSSCSCYIPPDNTYTLAMAPNDDGSTNLLAIPFSFCLYGTNYTDLYINNNGNISFVNSYFTFSSSSFPDPTYIMVAPFWGDVDTRGAGTVEYKITATAMYVNWVGVGYFSSMFDKVNTFQLIITDGNDPILPPGNNIAFCYGDMQWTTGAASSGINGFGGIPSTVGINKGDGVSYVQMGRFDQPGSVYDGGYGANDGVDWLDNKSFYFNSCNSTNLSPIASGINNCDTIKICGTGDTLIIDALFLAPEIGQNTTITINTNGVPGISVLNNVPGNTASAQVMIISSGANAGNHIITFTATDNGNPVGITNVNVNVFVDIVSAVAFFPILSGNLSFCIGDSSLLSIAPTTYDSYIWNTGSSNTSIQADTTGHYWVTASLNGCYKTVFADVVANPKPAAAITGNAGICLGGSLTLTASGGGTYLWWNSSDTSSTKTVNPSVNTTYIVEVKNSQGCTDTAMATVVLYPSPIADFNPDGACLNQAITFNDLSAFSGGIINGWSWDFGDGTAQVFIQNPVHLYANLGTYLVTLIVTTAGGCVDTISKNIVVHPLPQALFTAGKGCKGSIVPFTDQSTTSGSDALLLWSWDFGDGSPLNNNHNTFHQYNNVGSFTTHLLVISNFGCRDSTTQVVVINPPLVGNFTASDTVGCSPLCVNFQNQFIIPAGSHASYLWDFGDGSPFDLSSNPKHCFINNSLSLSQTFSVSLTVTPDTGCVTTVSKTNYITVVPSPIADFTVDPSTTSILFPIISFTNLSSGENAWNWNFGDLSLSSIINPPPHTYADTGTYNVTLIVSNQFSCSDTAVRPISIEADWSFYIPSSFTPNGNGINDKFQGYGFGIIEYEMLIFDRWGNKVYQTADYNLPWDGMVNHSKETEISEVYVYQFNIKNVKRQKHSYRGIVTLVR